MKFSTGSVCLIICVTFSVSFAIRLKQSFYKSVGSVCELPDTDEKKGVCTLFKDCPEAQCLRKHRKNINRCSMFPQTVCCDQEKKSVRDCHHYSSINIVTPKERQLSTEQIIICRCSERKAFFCYSTEFHETNGLRSIFCRYIRNSWENTPLIISGKKAKVGEFPHMALITYKSRGQERRCGGSLISQRFVLSAAHCFPSSEEMRRTLQVYLGGLRYPTDTDGIDKRKLTKNIKIRNVSDLIIHPKFKSDPEQYNDIALLMLDRPVSYTSNVLPACLYDQDVPKGTVLTATGWGAVDVAGTLPSEDLMRVNLVEFDMDECKRNLSNEASIKNKIKYGVLPTMLCAWDEGGGDTCQGDSGGPLSFKPVAATQIHSIVGITSFGPSPCSSNMPSIYTRVSEFLDWIECHVWPNITVP